MHLGLEGKVALVTGAGGGIGAAVCRMLGAEGASIAVTDIDLTRAQEQARRMSGEGIKTIALATDVTNAASVEAMVASSLNAFGRIDILVNNAGFQRDMRIGKMSEADWDDVVDVILKGAFLCTKAALPAMIDRQWGRIVNVSSRAHLGNPGQANYSAAKAGIIGFTRAMALENGRFGVTVNAVAPGLINTPAVQALPHYDSIREKAEKATPVARLGTPDDVADAIAFLVSERASYITGEVLHVTGGRY